MRSFSAADFSAALSAFLLVPEDLEELEELEDRELEDGFCLTVVSVPLVLALWLTFGALVAFVAIGAFACFFLSASVLRFPCSCARLFACSALLAPEFGLRSPLFVIISCPRYMPKPFCLIYSYWRLISALASFALLAISSSRSSSLSASSLL